MLGLEFFHRQNFVDKQMQKDIIDKLNAVLVKFQKKPIPRGFCLHPQNGVWSLFTRKPKGFPDELLIPSSHIDNRKIPILLHECGNHLRKNCRIV